MIDDDDNNVHCNSKTKQTTTTTILAPNPMKTPMKVEKQEQSNRNHVLSSQHHHYHEQQQWNNNNKWIKLHGIICIKDHTLCTTLDRTLSYYVNSNTDIKTNTNIKNNKQEEKDEEDIFNSISKFCVILPQQQTLNSKNKDINDEHKHKEDETIPEHNIPLLVLRDSCSNNKQEFLNDHNDDTTTTANNENNDCQTSIKEACTLLSKRLLVTIHHSTESNKVAVMTATELKMVYTSEPQSITTTTTTPSSKSSIASQQPQQQPSIFSPKRMIFGMMNITTRLATSVLVAADLVDEPIYSNKLNEEDGYYSYDDDDDANIYNNNNTTHANNNNIEDEDYDDGNDDAVQRQKKKQQESTTADPDIENKISLQKNDPIYNVKLLIECCISILHRVTLLLNNDTNDNICNENDIYYDDDCVIQNCYANNECKGYMMERYGNKDRSFIHFVFLLQSFPYFQTKMKHCCLDIGDDYTSTTDEDCTKNGNAKDTKIVFSIDNTTSELLIKTLVEAGYASILSSSSSLSRNDNNSKHHKSTNTATTNNDILSIHQEGNIVLIHPSFIRKHKQHDNNNKIIVQNSDQHTIDIAIFNLSGKINHLEERSIFLKNEARRSLSLSKSTITTTKTSKASYNKTRAKMYLNESNKCQTLSYNTHLILSQLRSSRFDGEAMITLTLAKDALKQARMDMVLNKGGSTNTNTNLDEMDVDTIHENMDDIRNEMEVMSEMSRGMGSLGITNNIKMDDNDDEQLLLDFLEENNIDDGCGSGDVGNIDDNHCYNNNCSTIHGKNNDNKKKDVVSGGSNSMSSPSHSLEKVNDSSQVEDEDLDEISKVHDNGNDQNILMSIPG